MGEGIVRFSVGSARDVYVALLECVNDFGIKLYMKVTTDGNVIANVMLSHVCMILVSSVPSLIYQFFKRYKSYGVVDIGFTVLSLVIPKELIN